MSDHEAKILVTAEVSGGLKGLQAIADKMRQGEALTKAQETALDRNNAAMRRMLDAVDSTAAKETKLAEMTERVNVALQRNQMSAVAAQNTLDRYKKALEDAGNAAGHAHTGMAGVTREMIVMAHEGVSGNFNRIPGSLMVLAERAGGLKERFSQLAGVIGLTGGQFAALAATAAVLGFAIYELIEKMHRTRDAAMEVRGAMAAIGHVGQASLAQLKGDVIDLSVDMGVSRKAAGEILSVFSSLPNASREWVNEIAASSAAYVKGAKDGKDSDEDQKAAAVELANAVRGGASAVAEYLKNRNLLTAEDAMALKNADGVVGDLTSRKILTDALASSTERLRNDLRDTNNETGRTKIKDPAGEMGAGKGDPAALAYLDEVQKLPERTREAIEQLRATWTGSQAELDAEIRQMWENVSQTIGQSNKTQSALELAYNQSVKAARGSAAAELIQTEKDKQNKLENITGESQVEILGGAVETDRRILQSALLSVEQRREWEHTLVSDQGKLEKEKLAESSRGLQEITNAAKKGSQERIDAAQQEVFFAFSNYGRQSAEYKSSLERMNSALSEWEAEQKRAATEALRLEEMQAKESIRIQNAQLNDVRGMMDEAVAEGRMTAQERIDMDRDVTLSVLRNERDQLAAQLDTLEKGTIAYETFAEQIEQIDEKMNSALVEAAKRTSERVKTERDKANQEFVKSFDSAFGPIERGFDQMVHGVMSHTETLKQSFRKVSTDIAQSFIEGLVKMMAKEEAYQLFMELGYTKMAVAAASSSAERTAAELAGDQARVAGSAEGMIEKKAINQEGVQSDAGAAAASVYKDVAAIPYVGWLLAPPAAAAAFAAVSAFSAAGGFANVPTDDALTFLHKNEMVLPASIANPLRSMIGNGSAAGGNSSTNVVGGSPTINISMGGNGNSVSAQQQSRLIASAVSNEIRNLNSGLISSLKAVVS
jgi:hypothetical protein